MKLKRVVVTGIGAITPIGNSIPEFWDGLVNGKSGGDKITLFDASLFKTQFACEVKGFDPLLHFDRKEVRKFDRYVQFALVASKEAISDANLEQESIDKNRIGVIFASGMGGIRAFEQ